MPVEINDLTTFVDAKWKSGCPQFHSTSWLVGGEEDLKGMLPVGDEGSKSHLVHQRNIPVFWLICQNCGHVELVGAKIVRAWLAEQKAGADHG